MSIHETKGEAYMPAIVGVTDLGLGNYGTISASEMNSAEKQALVNETANPEYHLPASNVSCCVDMRTEEADEDIKPEDSVADWQIAGSLAITETASDLMLTKNLTIPLSELAAKNTSDSIKAGNLIKVHGDEHAGKAGCGANRLLCDGSVLRSNAKSAEIVIPKVWAASQAIGLDKWLSEDGISEMIVTGNKNCETDKLLDTTPEELIDIMVANGAKYEELKGKHFEKSTVLKISDGAFAKKRFMLAHPRPEGGYNGVFAADLAAYRDAVFNNEKIRGGTEQEAAMRVAAGLLFNVGALKGLTAEETGNGETLPVILID